MSKIMQCAVLLGCILMIRLICLVVIYHKTIDILYFIMIQLFIIKFLRIKKSEDR